MALEQRKFQTSYIRELETPEATEKTTEDTAFAKSLFCRGKIPIRAVCDNPRPFLNNDFTYSKPKLMIRTGKCNCFGKDIAETYKTKYGIVHPSERKIHI